MHIIVRAIQYYIAAFRRPPPTIEELCRREMRRSIRGF